MKPLRRVLAVVAVFLSATLGHAALEFAGYTKSPTAALFVLFDTETKTISPWLPMGATFRGHTLVEHDSSADVLVLKRGDATLRLPLRSSKTGEGAVAVSGTHLIVRLNLSGQPNNMEEVKKQLAAIRKVSDMVRILAELPRPEPGVKPEALGPIHEWAFKATKETDLRLVEFRVVPFGVVPFDVVPFADR